MQLQEGKKLFAQMNCAGCHGYDAKGDMGPDLTDTAWRYGGTPIEVYKRSMRDGRKECRHGATASRRQPIWQLVAYIQSLGGTFAPAPPGWTSRWRPAKAKGAQAGQKQ